MKRKSTKYSLQEELEIIRSGDEKKIKQLLSYPLHSKSEHELLKIGNVNLIKKYIRNNRLSVSAEQALVKLENEELILCYLRERPLCETNQILLIRQRSFELLKTVINHSYLFAEVQVELVKTGNIGVIRDYIKRHNTIGEEVLIELIHRWLPNLIKYYISKGNALSDEAENELLSCGNTRLLRYYAKEYPLNDEAEKRIVTDPQFSSFAQDYIKWHGLTVSAIDRLIEKDDTELLTLCAKRCTLCYPQLLTLINNNRFDIVKIYLEANV